MANEITASLSLSAFKAAVMSAAVGRGVQSTTFTMTGNPWVEGTVLIGTSATAFGLGGVTAPHWAVFHNLDAVNFVTIRNGAVGTDLLKLLAGEWALCPLLDTAAPYGVADTAAALMEYLILSL